ncbi:MAG: EamA family transporter [Planctomycetaceae bacterium]|nr:EamA family transporter [Planctomycetales bacterium]MCB9937178.1 EamA family transporter [Planctomycetaceae bacterium]
MVETSDSSPESELAQRRKLQSRLLILAAAVLWSTSGFFAKSPLFEAWPKEIDGWPVRGPLLAFWRTSFASVILFPLVRRPRWTVKLIPTTLIFAAMSVAFLTAMTKTNAANAIWLQNTAPVWIFLVGVLVLGDDVHRRDWWLLGFALAGVGLILSFELQGQGVDGMMYGLLGGLTYAGVVVSLRWLRDEDAAWLVAMNHFVTGVVLLPYILYVGIWPSLGQLAFLAAFGMLQMGLPYWLFARGLQGIPGHEASGLVLLEPILVPVWVFLAWRSEPTYEAPAWWTLVGGGLILVGLICRYTNLRRIGYRNDQLRGEAENRNGQREEA